MGGTKPKSQSKYFEKHKTSVEHRHQSMCLGNYICENSKNISKNTDKKKVMTVFVTLLPSQRAFFFCTTVLLFILFFFSDKLIIRLKICVMSSGTVEENVHQGPVP